MINYKHDEKKIVALFLADELNDLVAKEIIERREVSNADEAIHLSRFIWAMVNRSAGRLPGAIRLRGSMERRN